MRNYHDNHDIDGPEYHRLGKGVIMTRFRYMMLTYVDDFDVKSPVCRPLPKTTTTIKKLPVTNNLLKKRFLYVQCLDDLYTDIEDQ